MVKVRVRVNDYYTYVNAYLTDNSNTARGFELYECLLVSISCISFTLLLGN